MNKTEMRNSNSTHIDRMTTREMLAVIQRENENAVKAVESALPQIEKAVDAITRGMEHGGRLIYIGCGTSGRLGILDAVECPPTYGIPADRVIGIIAGGRDSVFRSSEGKEDCADDGWRDIAAYAPCENDVVIGISAAGNAAYVLGAIGYAKSCGCVTVGLTSNQGSRIDLECDIPIVTDTGAEVVTGSTRMKAGTAQKMVLNMLSTCAMIKTGKVYENLMINIKPVNIKLRQRMIRIVSEIFECDPAAAEKMLVKYNWDIRRAVDEEGY